MSKVKKHWCTITFRDSSGELQSIRQFMADYSIGAWCRFFIRQGFDIVCVDIPEP